MQLNTINSFYKKHKESALFGRYITTESITPLLKNLTSKFKIDTIGRSVNDAPIYSVTVGSGSKKILMWSQMHGNESTTTKVVFDLFNVLSESNLFSETVLKTCTIKIIPILNPDGAAAYTRINANKVDLNRDAVNLSQPESKMLRSCFNNFKPNYCFNLHGQRTIFSAGSVNKSATVSFLSPAQDATLAITPNRKVAMALIVKMNRVLQQEIPNQVGIYDDAYNGNCVGDAFQVDVPTVLFEAGHYANDYDREETRRLIFASLVASVDAIANDSIALDNYNAYFEIPENEKLFFDIIIRNVPFKNEIIDIAIQYKEQLVEGKVEFVQVVERLERLDAYYAHKTLQFAKNEQLPFEVENLKIGQIILEKI